MFSANNQVASSLRTILLCFIVAILEGLDLQAVGVAAPVMAAVFSLNSVALGWVFNAGLIGLLPGAIFGDRLAARFRPQKGADRRGDFIRSDLPAHCPQCDLRAAACGAPG